MKDLDFDELDRAVSTLMGSVSGVSEPAKQDDTKVLTITETLKDNRPPVMPVGEVAIPPQVAAQPESEPVAVAVKRPEPTSLSRPAPLAARRGGRFMDVVTPSSASRKPSQGVSRQGVTLAPLDEAVETQKAPESIATQETAEIPSIPSATNLENDSLDTTEWPDPLEFNQAHDEASEARVSDELDESTDTTEPLSSPFLADAKVEKRPLGTPAPELYNPAQYDVEAVDVTNEPEADEPAPVEQVPKMELPEELQGDVMAIESSVSDATPTTGDASPIVETVQSQKETQEPKLAAASVAAAPSVSLATGTGSIPQQYREEPSTSDQTTGSIYDTASYHQPLEHPAKKKAGWLWVIWVLVLLILGAGGGALAYLYLLQ